MEIAWDDKQSRRVNEHQKGVYGEERTVKKKGCVRVSFLVRGIELDSILVKTRLLDKKKVQRRFA